MARRPLLPAPEAPVGWIRRLGLALTLLAVIAIAAATLTPASQTDHLQQTPLTCLVCGAHGGLDVLLNLVLFIPFGVGLALAGVRGRTALALGAAFSFGVEAAQLLAIHGRDPSLSDLLTNSTGTLLGWGVTRHWRAWAVPAPHKARRLAVAMMLTWAALSGLTAWGLAPDVPPGPYFVHQAPPTSDWIRSFEGEIVARSLNGGSHPAVLPTEALADELRAPALRLDATVRASYPPGTTRPVASVFTHEWAAVVLLGQRHESLVLRVLTRSARLRLPLPTVALPGVFTTPAAGATARLVDVAGGRTPGDFWVRAEHASAARTLTMPRTPLVGWALVASTLVPYGPWGPWLTDIWVAVFLLPLGYWERRGWRGAPWRGAAAAVAAVIAAAVLGRVALPAPTAWFGVGGALVVGWLAARLLERREARLTPR